MFSPWLIMFALTMSHRALSTPDFHPDVHIAVPSCSQFPTPPPLLKLGVMTKLLPIVENIPVLSLDHDQGLLLCLLTLFFTSGLYLHLVNAFWLASLEKHSLSYLSPEVKLAPKLSLSSQALEPAVLPCSVPFRMLAGSLCRALCVNQTSPMLIRPASIWIPPSTHTSDCVFCQGPPQPGCPQFQHVTGVGSVVHCLFFTVISMSLSSCPCNWEKEAINIEQASSCPILQLCFAELPAVDVNPKLPCLAHFPCFTL